MLQALDDFAIQKPIQKSAVERVDNAATSGKEPKFLNAGQASEMFTTFRRAGDGNGSATVNWRLKSTEENDEIQFMEELDKEKNYLVATDENQESSKFKYSKINVQSRSEQSNLKSYDLTGVQELSSSLHRNSVPASHPKGRSPPNQNYLGKRSLQQPPLKNSSVKENGHRVDPQLSSKCNDIVALPSTSKETPYAPDKLCAVPLLNAQGSYFQIGPAGQPGEQMFEYSVTIVFAKFLDQVSVLH